MRCRYIHMYLFIPSIVFALLFLSLIVTLIRGHVAGSSPPLMVARI